jgi:hypothetical protein
MKKNLATPSYLLSLSVLLCDFSLSYAFIATMMPLAMMSLNQCGAHQG